MRKWLFLSVLALAGLLGSNSRASAFWFHTGYPSSAAFPCIYPPGYYTNTYYFGWYYPWFAYYNYSHGSFANWYLWGGYATYGGNCGLYGCGPNGCGPYGCPPGQAGHAGHQHAAAPSAEGTVTVTLPADARLLFNGTPAAGTGATRTYRTPALVAGQDYAYDLTAEVTRNGEVQKVSKRVTVRAGETTTVTLVDDAARTTSK